MDEDDLSFKDEEEHAVVDPDNRSAGPVPDEEEAEALSTKVVAEDGPLAEVNDAD